uniref:BLTX452 n=1 Tax=Nephila pilipes TaxID=299642 RepID=A0A076L2I1_NEPPI|nr:BLTX452 [Nephila pilipes]
MVTVCVLFQFLISSRQKLEL